MGGKAMIKMILIFALAFATSAGAQMVPPIEKGEPVAMVMESPSVPVNLNSKEQRALEIAREWKNNPDKPRRSADGGVIYLYGATLPTLITTPLQVSAIHLQPGEEVNDVHAGDSARWRITPSMIGSGPTAITVVMVKPTESGLITNLIINTNRRSYTLKLMATRHEWVSYVAFDYPDDQQRAWANYRAKQGKAENASTLPTGQNVANLDFNYQVTGDNPGWKPQRVYNDGTKTYIQFSSAKFADEAPVLVTLGKGKSLWSGPTEKLVNYRLIGDAYVVDEVFDQAALISGVGNDQTKVTIARGKGK
jgi:P-type conjugative transfer protein TrbG